MSLEKHDSSCIISKYYIVSYDCRKNDGDLPKIKIGKKCTIATNCTFVLANHLLDTFSTSLSRTNLFSHKKGNPSGYSKGDIIIKNDVCIGANSTISDGITIGNGAVITAGSVVTKDVPPYAVVGGNPATIMKYRFTRDIIDEIEKTQFWEMDISEINNFNIHTKNIHDLLDEIKEYKLKKT